MIAERVRGLAGGLALGLLAASCRTEPEPVMAPVQQETPGDEIRRIGARWQSVQEDRGFRSPPAAISLFQTRVTSTIELQPNQKVVEEDLLVEEVLELRGGTRFKCQARVKVRSKVKYGRLKGEAAVQLSRPPVTIQRRCEPAGIPEPTLELASGAARFVLRADQLLAVEPPLEKRTYLPID